MWYNDQKLTASFGAALAEADVLTESSDFKAFFNAPQRYNETFDAWKDAGYPTSDEDDGWQEFLDALPDGDNDSEDDDEDNDEADDSEE